MACNECFDWRGVDPRAKKIRRLGAVSSFLLRKPDLWARHCPDVAIF